MIKNTNKINYSDNQEMNYFLTIAASDNSGGAGIQQDIKVAHDLGYWALSAVTGITVQDFHKAYNIKAVNSMLLQKQIERCFTSFTVKVVKIGAVCSLDNSKVIVDCFKRFKVDCIVLDPVLSASDGVNLTDSNVIDHFRKELFPLTSVITPNKPEFEILSDEKFNTIDEGVEIAELKCKEWGVAIFLKGGHFNGAVIKEALITSDSVFRFENPRLSLKYQHGTGCMLSSALACYLGNGFSMIEAIQHASTYLRRYYKV